MSRNTTFKPRTARTPQDGEPQYVIAHGAPMHYVDGYGYVGAGAIVSLALGVTPGRWMVEVAPEDAAKALASEDDAQRLAIVAAAKIAANKNADDEKRKKLKDAEGEAQRAEAEQARAQAEADGLAKVAEAEAKALEEAGRADSAKQEAEAAKAERDKAVTDLAAAQARIADLEAANAAQKEAEKTGGKK